VYVCVHITDLVDLFLSLMAAQFTIFFIAATVGPTYEVRECVKIPSPIVGN
jgi:hypothetical protein